MKELTKEQKQDIIDNAPKDATHLLGFDNMKGYAIFDGSDYWSIGHTININVSPEYWHILYVLSDLRKELEQDSTHQFNDGHITEGLDRCNTIMIMIEELLREHPSVLKANVSSDVDTASKAIMKAYQKIGELE